MEKLHFFEDKTIFSVSHSVYYYIKKALKKTCIPKMGMQVAYSIEALLLCNKLLSVLDVNLTSLSA